MLSALISSVLSYPALPLTRQPEHQRYVIPGPLVLENEPLKFPKPSSRTTLIGEQPNPWDLLQPQDVMSRHRGAKLRRRYERLGEISLLSLEYLLSHKRRRSHELSPDHLGLVSHLLDL